MKLDLLPHVDTPELRDYQIDAVARLRAETRRCLLVAPTGSGKTVIAAELIRQERDKRFLVIAHRRELIAQAVAKLAEFGVEAGVILAGEPVDPDARVQVASVQTLWRRRATLPPADVVLIDESHHATARTYRRIVASYPNAQIIGMTATPCRNDGRGLGDIFEVMIELPGVAELIAQGHLVGTKVYAPSEPDLDDVRVRMGDYVESDLAEAVDKPQLVGDIVTHWHRLAAGRKTVVFATSVAHSIHLKDEFIKSGVRAEHIDGSTPKEMRDEILRRLSRGEVQVVVNCMVLTEGWDQPDVACVILARPTKHLGLYRQMTGRVLRPYPGKVDALVLDHAGAVFQHGFVEDDVHWTLRPDQRAHAPAHTERQHGSSARRLVACTKCAAVRRAGKPCPACGHFPQRPGQHHATGDGDLAQVGRDRRPTSNAFSEEVRATWHAMLLQIAIERGYKLGWVAHKFRDKFGTWPRDFQVEPMTPTPEVRSWVRSRDIAFAKSRGARGDA